MAMTRRDFLERLGAAGGYSAVYLGMQAMGLLNAPPAGAEEAAAGSATAARARDTTIDQRGIVIARPIRPAFRRRS